MYPSPVQQKKIRKEKYINKRDKKTIKNKSTTKNQEKYTGGSKK
jgi:hypothetical protein